MMKTAGERTARLVEGRHVLVIQDTARLRGDGDRCSVQLHPAIAVDATDGALLGLVHVAFPCRNGGESARRRHRPFAAKESRRWCDAACEAAKLGVGGAACVTVMAEREGGIDEEFAAKPAAVNLPIRHAILVCDGAGRHQRGRQLLVPDTITLLSLPACSPELNPMENVWDHLRQNEFSATVWNTCNDIVDSCQSAWNFLAADPDRITSIGHRQWACVSL